MAVTLRDRRRLSILPCDNFDFAIVVDYNHQLNCRQLQFDRNCLAVRFLNGFDLHPKMSVDFFGNRNKAIPQLTGLLILFFPCFSRFYSHALACFLSSRCLIFKLPALPSASARFHGPLRRRLNILSHLSPLVKGFFECFCSFFEIFYFPLKSSNHFLYNV